MLLSRSRDRCLETASGDSLLDAREVHGASVVDAAVERPAVGG